MDVQRLIYDDFRNHNKNEKFKVIISNPPFSLALQFVEMCFELLDDNGEMIFIVPSNFLRLTSSSSLISRMVEEGFFTTFLFPNDERLFKGANVDVVAFRYEKGINVEKVLVNDREMFCNCTNGLITFSKEKPLGTTVSELFDVFVGFVSGKEEVFRVDGSVFDDDSGSIMKFLVDTNRFQQYIFIQAFPTNNGRINEYLLSNKECLLGRKIRNFNEENWFEWGAVRNRRKIEMNIGRPCIYVKNITRDPNPAFVSVVSYFSGSLICLLPRREMSAEDLGKIASYINNDSVKANYMQSGRFSIGQKQLSFMNIDF